MIAGTIAAVTKRFTSRGIYFVEIHSIKVSNFKRSQNIEIETPPLTVVVGGNNCGKSSLLQGIHFAVTVLQSARSAGDDARSMSTLGFDQFIYKPTADLIGLYHGGGMTSKVGPDFHFRFSVEGKDEQQDFELKLRRGKNANIATLFDAKSPFFSRAGDRTQPLSILVPGLAGVPLREEKRTPSILTNGIAQGDSNLYLRNVLLNIIEDEKKEIRFHEIMNSIFPSLKIQSSFDERIHLYIDINVKMGGATIPLEMVGTGCLQAIQLAAYVTAYNPALLLLDEPDAHLHPSNQRLLAATLQKISEDGSTKIILASHSRHMFDALTYNDCAAIVWLKDGVKQPYNDRASLSVLLDLGALDSYELISGSKRKLIFLTEDTKLARLKVILKANGLEEAEYLTQPLNGVSNLGAAAPIVDFFTKQGEDTRVVIHRDGDCMTQEEKDWWIERESKKFPAKSLVFVTSLSDIEHLFCSPQHVANVFELSLAESKAMIEDILSRNAANFLIEFTQKRNDLKAKALREYPKFVSAHNLITNNKIQFLQVRGKSIFPFVLEELKNRSLSPGLLTSTPSDALVDERLKAFIDEMKAQIRSAPKMPVLSGDSSSTATAA